jgi:apoptosis-inducing factor 3
VTDLVKGIPESDLADGKMLAGKVGKEDVLLARSGDEVFAVGAFCTHYHAPLADGLLVGNTIRCPWHHACFDLHTGSPTAAPALRTLSVFRTVRENGTIRVEPQPIDVPKPHVEASTAHVVIVGAGAAGSAAANELRRLGHAGRVTLLTSEERMPYDKPNLSKDYLVGKAPEEWLPLLTDEEYAERKIELRRGTTVASIDTAAHEVVLTGGERLAYDRLILATGGSPRRFDATVDPLKRALYLRTWDDAVAVREAAGNAKRAVIIGASFIGLELAASLRELGLDVTVVGREERPLERPLGRKVAEFLYRTHLDHGVTFHLSRTPAEITATSVRLDDGTVLEADLVAAGLGVILDIKLATDAGLTVDNGVVVDQHLRTSVDVYAAGDIASYPDPATGVRVRVEHWAAAARQGQYAARNAMGQSEPFNAIPFFWSQHYDLSLSYVGHATRTDDVEIVGSFEDSNAAAIYYENGHVTAVVTLYRDDLSLAVEAAMERGASDAEIEHLVRGGF